MKPSSPPRSAACRRMPGRRVASAVCPRRGTPSGEARPSQRAKIRTGSHRCTTAAAAWLRRVGRTAPRGSGRPDTAASACSAGPMELKGTRWRTELRPRCNRSDLSDSTTISAGTCAREALTSRAVLPAACATALSDSGKSYGPRPCALNNSNLKDAQGYFETAQLEPMTGFSAETAISLSQRPRRVPRKFVARPTAWSIRQPIVLARAAHERRLCDRNAKRDSPITAAALRQSREYNSAPRYDEFSKTSSAALAGADAMPGTPGAGQPVCGACARAGAMVTWDRQHLKSGARHIAGSGGRFAPLPTHFRPLHAAQLRAVLSSTQRQLPRWARAQRCSGARQAVAARSGALRGARAA